MGDGYEQVDDGDTTWRFERTFLRSSWRCIWGRGCLGIGAEPAPDLALGCCSLGADLEGHRWTFAQARPTMTL